MVQNQYLLGVVVATIGIVLFSLFDPLGEGFRWGKGLPSASCVQKDSDGDGIPDSHDTDDDNDGIPDIHDDDDDGDGIHDKHDEEEHATFHCSGPPQYCQHEFVKCFDKDSDGDGIPDSRDPDDDNDGIPDTKDNDDDGDGIPDKHDKQNVFITCAPKPDL